jgi:hypothetical protein
VPAITFVRRGILRRFCVTRPTPRQQRTCGDFNCT